MAGMNTDLALLVSKLKHSFPEPPAREYDWWPTAPLTVLDCVLSLNRHYDRFCLPRVEQFAANHPEVQALEGLLNLIDSYPTPLEFSIKELNYRDERRAATLRGVTVWLMGAQERFSGATEMLRLREWARSVSAVKPDVHIKRFVSDAVGRSIQDWEALSLLEAAASQLSWDLSALDNEMWILQATGRKPE